MRRCPYCAEDIDDDAVRCPHCGSALTSAGPTVAAPSAASAAPSASASPSVSASGPGGGGVQFSHTGQRYLLGYDASDFGIWDRSAPGSPVERFPRSDDGWSQAWRRYSSLEPHSQPVQAAAGPAGYEAAPVGYATEPPSAAPWQQHSPTMYYVPQHRRQNGLAVAALVLGIVGLVLFVLIVPPILALVFGLVSLNQIKDSRGAQEGQGLAVAGIVLGSVGILFFVIYLIAAINHAPGF